MFGDLPEVRTSGPLCQFGSRFAEHLVARGHGRNHIRNLKNLLRDLDQWLVNEGLRAEDLRRSEIERFQAERVAAGRKILVSVRALTPLMEYLRGVGIEPQEPEAAADGPLAAILQRYRVYLATERPLRLRETSPVRTLTGRPASHKEGPLQRSRLAPEVPSLRRSDPSPHSLPTPMLSATVAIRSGGGNVPRDNYDERSSIYSARSARPAASARRSSCPSSTPRR
jgi:hypothetical protein